MDECIDLMAMKFDIKINTNQTLTEKLKEKITGIRLINPIPLFIIVIFNPEN